MRIKCTLNINDTQRIHLNPKSLATVKILVWLALGSCHIASGADEYLWAIPIFGEQLPHDTKSAFMTIMIESYTRLQKIAQKL